jgi:hypothetical protein
VYATDKAMAEEPVPLSDALKTFVRLDNRLFKQELLQSNHHQAGSSHKRSAGLPGDGSQSKRLQRSASMDSMATNQASAGGSDDGMRDAPFDNDAVFGDGAWDPSLPSKGAAQYGGIPDLTHLPSPSPSPPPQQQQQQQQPAYANDVEMESGVSPALAQVTLGDNKSSSSSPSTAPAEEMRERPNAGFVTRPNHMHTGGGGDGAAAPAPAPVANGTGAVGEEEPLIDLDDRDETGFKARVNGF